jgi:hypothetical protein
VEEAISMRDAMDAARTCPWRSAEAAADATTCPACGAVLAQRDSLGGVAISGLTSIDPALAAADGRPMRLAGPSPSQGMASGAVAAAMIGGPVGAVALGGMAAVVAAEYLGARRPGVGAPGDLDAVGRPSELARLAAERLAAHADSNGSAEAAEPEAETQPSAAGLLDPWRDMPGG